MTVLFVCTGNTCRSPMAEALLRDAALKRRLDITAVSAGTSAPEGGPISKNARKVLKSRGLSPEEYRSKSVSKQLIDGADLVLTMTASHRDAVSAQFPENKDRIYTLGEYAGDFSDVPDPFGQDLEVYKRCLNDLEQKIAGAVKRIELDFFSAEARKTESQKTEVHMKNIALGCDNAGFNLKNAVIKYLQAESVSFTDFGAYDDKPSDYPAYAGKVVSAILSGEFEMGLLFCGTGIGVSIAANRRRGIRAALCHDVFSARAARSHNDANILTMGGRVIGEGLAVEIVKTFLETPFSGEERHVKRILMIEEEP